LDTTELMELKQYMNNSWMVVDTVWFFLCRQDLKDVPRHELSSADPYN